MTKPNLDRLVLHERGPEPGEWMGGWRAPLVVEGYGLADEVRAVAAGDTEAATSPFVAGWAQAWLEGRATLNGERYDYQDVYCAPH